MASGGSGALVEYSLILVFIVAPLVGAIFLAVQFVPEIDLGIPVSPQNQFTSFFLLVIGTLALIEGRGTYLERGGGVNGVTFAVIVSMVVFIVGYALTVYIIALDYNYSSGEINRYLGYYLFIGATLIFILGRNYIFLHEAIVRASKR